jgi:Flp pilus assembly protein TadG
MQRHAGRDSRSALRGCLAGILSRSRAATSLPRPFHRCWRIAGTFPAGAWLATPTLRACRSALRASGIGRAGLVRSRSGLAALEFALIAPILVAACAGLYDLTSAFLASQRINMAALAIAQIGTYQAANSNNTNMNILNLTETQTATSAIYAYLPDTLTAANSSFGVLVTSVVVTLQDPACTSSCTYIPNVAWSGQYQGGAGSTRVCGASALSWVADTAAASSTTLPNGSPATPAGARRRRLLHLSPCVLHFHYRQHTHGTIGLLSSAHRSDDELGAVLLGWLARQYGAVRRLSVVDDQPVTPSPTKVNRDEYIPVSALLDGPRRCHGGGVRAVRHGDDADSGHRD